MKLTTKALTLALIAAGGLAIAAEATNPAAKARQETMDAISAASKVLGNMAKGSVAYDAAAAAEAQAALAAAAATITTVFEPNESDPKSKAKPEIWANWADFQTKAEALVDAAGALDASSLDGIKAGMGAVGGACGACHETYRM
jgi:cytochrome c556